MPDYGYLLDGDCVPAFAGAARERRKLLSWFEELANNPFQTGDYEELTPAARKSDEDSAGNSRFGPAPGDAIDRFCPRVGAELDGGA
jgi:hypothetical protein